MYCIGFDIGSSSVKAALIDQHTGKEIARSSYPDTEMSIHAPQAGWAEQDPNIWWEALSKVTKNLLQENAIKSSEIKSIGISYQMHGLVLIDKDLKVLRPSIIWCDSRSVEIGDRAFDELGESYCFNHCLNSPGNFTASKLAWVKTNEPALYEKIYKVLLPGDFIAMKLTGEINTTISGLSEGIFWDFVETFSVQGKVHASASEKIGLEEGTPVTYRAGDQPNNAMSLGVLSPGEIAATGGTSGVVYGIADSILSDKEMRVNAFAHVNHRKDQHRIGQLLCINGAGIQYAWIKKEMSMANESYESMEQQLSEIPIGSEGLQILPFGNGAERMLRNLQTGAQFSNVQFNIHRKEHFYRAALEGIAFSFVYGIKGMKDLGISPSLMRVGNDNLFQSKTFSQTICNLLDCTINMLHTTGAVGAAQASRVATGNFEKIEEAINTSDVTKVYTPDSDNDLYHLAYANWESTLNNVINFKTKNS